MAVRFCGFIDDFSQLERGDCPPEAVQLREANDMMAVLRESFKDFWPMLVLMMALSLVRLSKGLNWAAEMRTSWIFAGIVVFVLLYIVLIFVHEGIHALLLPLKSDKEIWLYQGQAAFVYCNAPMSRLRFVVMSLAPMTVLGILPFVVWLFSAERPAAVWSIFWMILSWTMIYGGMGDYYNAKNVLEQVPKDAVVFNYGMHTYWLPRK
ncbi:MAG: DUF3267 domain-containing protein [Peptococcaceae bacterium]|nr:DUF3267 domain-containing protein [Peptococcaceae bacterium]